MRERFEIYAQVYDEYVDELYGYAIALGYPEDLAMDAIHDVFCRLVVSDSKIDNMRFYLLRSIKNRLIDIGKRSKVMMLDDMDMLGFRTDISFADDNMTSHYEREQIEVRVRTLMDKLSATQKEAIYLRYIQEMDYDCIAEILGITPESARKLVWRALEKMRYHNVPKIIMLLAITGQILKNGG